MSARNCVVAVGPWMLPEHLKASSQCSSPKNPAYYRSVTHRICEALSKGQVQHALLPVSH